MTTQGQTDRQTETDFIICPMLYAIAMGQIKMVHYDVFLLAVFNVNDVCYS